jgi:hypothetical protein
VFFGDVCRLVLPYVRIVVAPIESVNRGDDEGTKWLDTDRHSRIERGLRFFRQSDKKIANVRHKHPEWWLVSVDYIGFGLDDFDRSLFRDEVSISHAWDKIVLLDPNGKRDAMEI